MDDSMEVPEDEQGNPLVDQAALKEIIERGIDALRPIGLTVMPQSVQAMVDPGSGEMMLTFITQVRPQAATSVVEDLEARKEFNRIQAERHDQMVDAKADEIRQLLRDNDDLTDLDAINDDVELCPTTGDEHKLHPSTGHCLDCGFGLEL